MQRLNRMRNLAVLLTALFLSACAPASPGPADERGPDVAGGTDCGSFDLDQGEPMFVLGLTDRERRRYGFDGDPARAEAERCMKRALASGDRAQMSLEFPTVEGDPIRVYYRAIGRGALEIDEDGTADAFGAGAWIYLDCTGATSIEQRGSCREARR